MAIIVNGVSIPANADSIRVKGALIDTVVCNGMTVWQKQKYYYIAFSGNGATSGSMAQQTLPVWVDTKLRDNAYSRTGYSFFGWSSTSGGSREYTNGQTVTDIAAAGTTKTLYALWDAITYYVQFNGNGNNGGSMGRQAIKYDASTALAANAFTRSYFAFVGWGTSAGGPRVYTNQQTVRNLKTAHGDVVNLYALWRVAMLSNGTDYCTPASGGWYRRVDWGEEAVAEYYNMPGVIIGGTGARINIYNKTPFDVTYMSSITVRMQGGNIYGHLWVGISSDPYADGVEAGSDVDYFIEGRNDFVIDVSTLSGSKYFKVVANADHGHGWLSIESITCS